MRRGDEGVRYQGENTIENSTTLDDLTPEFRMVNSTHVLQASADATREGVLSALIRNILRLALGTAFVVALTCAGYLWSQPDSRIAATSMAVGAIVALAVYEAMTRARENHARSLQDLIKKDEDDVAEFKERVRLLDGVVHILWQDNAELRRGRLVGEIEPARRQASSVADRSPQKAIDDATAKLLALPQPEGTRAARQDMEGARHE